MKLKLSFIALLSLLFFSAEGYSQVDRSIGRSQYKRPKPSKEKFDFVEETVKYVTKELNLDAFQSAAVREIIEAEKEELVAISQNPDLPEQARKDKGKIISERIDEKILKLLSPEQADKYKKLQEKKKS